MKNKTLKKYSKNITNKYIKKGGMDSKKEKEKEKEKRKTLKKRIKPKPRLIIVERLPTTVTEEFIPVKREKEEEEEEEKKEEEEEKKEEEEEKEKKEEEEEEEKKEEEKKEDLKIQEEQQEEGKKKKMVRLNETFIDLMDKLANIMTKHGEQFRAKAYQKAQESLMTYIPDIISPEQLKGLPGIGPTIMEKLKEYVSTGTLRILEREKNNPINIIGEIYGVGPKKAKELVDAGITTIVQLRARQDILNDIQRVGLKYYEDIMQRIPRAEIDDYNMRFMDAFNQVKVLDSHFEIVGSYRRGALESGDIDVIITSPDPAIFRSFIDILIKDGIILPDGILSRGSSKCLAIAKLPGTPFARRVDFLYTNLTEYPFAILYFTGSKIFNTVMRGRALSLGYSLNEHGMYKMEGKKKGEKVDIVFKSERDIFDFLGMEYKEPRGRINGLSVVVKEKESASLQEPLPLLSVPLLSVPLLSVPLLSVPLEVELPLKSVKTTSLKKGKVQQMSDKKTKLKPKVKLQLQIVSEQDTEFALVTTLQKQLKDAHTDEAVLEYIGAFKKHGIEVLHALTEHQLISILQEADKAFHLNKTPIMTDNEYDIVKEYTQHKFPENSFFLEVGTPVEKNKVELPYIMASMDKIKPDTSALITWKQKFSGPYVLSCKLDGVSGMYSTEGKVAKLYTRGNGRVGQDISHLIPYLHLPKEKNIVVRGEFIIPRAIFHSKYADKFANPRNLVAGIVNRISVDRKGPLTDIHFVAYELIQPTLKPSEQMARLKDAGFETVLYKEESSEDLTNENLSEVLMDWRQSYLYEIDGVIVTDDKIYPRTTGNPEHSFAFKMVLSDQIAEAKVVAVLWTPSKDGYLKPRVQIEPIQLGGVTIEYATGFNGAFIQQNKIGVGALIQIIRSGDVIPHIRGVTVAAEEPMMPNVPYKWNDTHVDVLLEDVNSDATVREKNITGFFRGIGVDGLSSGNVGRIVAAGFDNIPAILKMSIQDFLTVEGFKGKLANKIHDGIKEKIGAASLLTLMSASNLFGRGFSDKKLELILDAYPDILTSTESGAAKVKQLASVKGMAEKTAEAFVKNIPVFLEFLVACELQDKVGNGDGKVSIIDTENPLYKKTVVLTGTRDKILLHKLKSVGAIIGSSVSKNTFAVIAPSLDEDTGKAEDARKLNVPIFTPVTFMAQYFA